MKPVFPKNPNGIALIGDMPRAVDSFAPFDGSYFGSLSAMCREAGFNFKDCFLGNLISFFPGDGLWSSIPPTQLADERAELVEALRLYEPKVVVFLGQRAVSAFKPDCTDIEAERGQPFLLSNTTPALCTWHPRDIFKQFSHNILAIADLTKAFKYSKQGWKEPLLNLNFQPTFQEVISTLQRFLDTKAYLSFDIETDHDLKLTCIGFAYNPTNAITIPFVKSNSERYWSHTEEKAIWPLLTKVLESCPLLGHNACHFESRVLGLVYGINAHIVGDTMFAHWECYAELLKSLGFCSSLYTDFPYWKDVLKQARSGKLPRWKEFEYNAKDCAITLQVAYAIKDEFKDRPAAVESHYRFNVRISRAFQYMSIRGVVLDKPLLDKRLTDLRAEADGLHLQLTCEAGKEINVRSPKQVKEWLYNDLKLPPQYKVVKDEDGNHEEKESADYLSLLYLARSFPTLPAILTAARLRKLYKRISSLAQYQARPTGRISWDFNCVGTETGRASGYKPLDGCGVQPQNVDRKDRDLFKADDGLLWLKADLEGADSWTVAAQCAALGDSTMLEDLKAGVKPAQALAIAHLFGHHLISAPASEIASYKKQLKDATKHEEESRGPGRATYNVMKAVSHGSNYGMQKHTMHQNIFKTSAGELWIDPEDCVRFQNLYLKRYKGIVKVHESMVHLMNSQGYLDSFGGTRRYFMGRKDNMMVRTMLSHIPQANTSYTTNRLIERVFYWSENRYANNPRRLIMEPVNQVHDETDLLLPAGQLDYCRELFWKMVDIPCECWGVKFTIPFEANYGPNWGAAKEEL